MAYRWLKWPTKPNDGGDQWINLDLEVSDEVSRNFWWEFAQRTKCLEHYYGNDPKDYTNE